MNENAIDGREPDATDLPALAQHTTMMILIHAWHHDVEEPGVGGLNGREAEAFITRAISRAVQATEAGELARVLRVYKSMNDRKVYVDATSEAGTRAEAVLRKVNV